MMKKSKSVAWLSTVHSLFWTVQQMGREHRTVVSMLVNSRFDIVTKLWMNDRHSHPRMNVTYLQPASYCDGVDVNLWSSLQCVMLILFAFCSAHTWAINIRCQDLIKQTPLYLNKNCYLCSENFEPQMFLNDLKNRLQPTAVPTVVQVPNLPKLLFSSSRKRTCEGVSGVDSAL